MESSEQVLNKIICYTINQQIFCAYCCYKWQSESIKLKDQISERYKF